ncbi:GrpB family protein [Microbacterium sp. NPDC057659]|uniref:GrpB family protein n=1 Tax=Microbacterium sp. NPDC057659 TaxID=3346198 RepID=UPI00366A775E
MILVAHDPDWHRRFEEIADELRRVGDRDWKIEHIGSTAVPGIRAKPIIDLAVRLHGEDDLEHHRLALEGLGWRIGSRVRSHRVMVFETDGVRTRIAHFFAPEQWEHAHQRVFRDWLRQHPDDAERYERGKIEASADPSSYNSAKTEVVQEIMDRARAARGLPSVDVYDKR